MGWVATLRQRRVEATLLLREGAQTSAGGARRLLPLRAERVALVTPRTETARRQRLLTLDLRGRAEAVQETLRDSLASPLATARRATLALLTREGAADTDVCSRVEANGPILHRTVARSLGWVTVAPPPPSPRVPRPRRRRTPALPLLREEVGVEVASNAAAYDTHVHLALEPASTETPQIGVTRVAGAVPTGEGPLIGARPAEPPRPPRHGSEIPSPTLPSARRSGEGRLGY